MHNGRQPANTQTANGDATPAIKNCTLGVAQRNFETYDIYRRQYNGTPDMYLRTGAIANLSLQPPPVYDAVNTWKSFGPTSSCCHWSPKKRALSIIEHMIIIPNMRNEVAEEPTNCRPTLRTCHWSNQLGSGTDDVQFEIRANIDIQYTAHKPRLSFWSRLHYIY